MNEDEIIAIARALSNETRYRILREIPAEGRKCCKELSESFGVSKPTITHHINKLRELQLVTGAKKQTYHYLTRNQEKLEDFREALGTDFENTS